MKKLMFAFLILGSFSVGAIADDEVLTGNWICTAAGYDMQGNRRSVFGDYRATEADAESSALSYCSMQGLGACQVSSCFENK